jgi:uncharacterized protein with PQ loop repeat
LKTYQRMIQHSSRKKSHSKAEKVTTVDVMAYIGGIAGNLAILPQVVKVWQGPAPGLAVSTWILFLFVDISWLIYAVRRKQLPLLVTEVMGLFFYIAVISGWYFHSMLS